METVSLGRNGSNIPLSLSARDAHAGVGDTDLQPKRRHPGPEFFLDVDETPSPFSVNLMALPTKFNNHLAKPSGNPPINASGTSGWTSKPIPILFLMSGRAH